MDILWNRMGKYVEIIKQLYVTMNTYQIISNKIYFKENQRKNIFKKYNYGIYYTV